MGGWGWASEGVRRIILLYIYCIFAIIGNAKISGRARRAAPRAPAVPPLSARMFATMRRPDDA